MAHVSNSVVSERHVQATGAHVATHSPEEALYANGFQECPCVERHPVFIRILFPRRVGDVNDAHGTNNAMLNSTNYAME